MPETVEETLGQIEMGQRIRVIDGSLVHYRQLGTVVDAGTGNDRYVHPDYDKNRLDPQILCHSKELEAVFEESQIVAALRL